ncbi:Hypothetical predicted protein, partial [Paramuricea clavata]
LTTDNDHINRKVSLWPGDITRLEIDAIVSAAGESLLGSIRVNGHIHQAAGKGLQEEYRKLNGCDIGDAKITSGQKLPAKHVIHTVGPFFQRVRLLESCYNSCLRLVKEHELSSVAFWCISGRAYHGEEYPKIEVAHVALKTVKSWLEENNDWVGRIIFCASSQENLDIYQKLMLQYFPCTIEKDAEETEWSDNDDEKMDTLENDVDDRPTTKLAEGTTETTVGGKDKTAIKLIYNCFSIIQVDATSRVFALKYLNASRRRDKWIQLVCSKHFTEECFVYGSESVENAKSERTSRMKRSKPVTFQNVLNDRQSDILKHDRLRELVENPEKALTTSTADEPDVEPCTSTEQGEM